MLLLAGFNLARMTPNSRQNFHVMGLFVKALCLGGQVIFLSIGSYFELFKMYLLKKKKDNNNKTSKQNPNNNLEIKTSLQSLS